MGRLFIVLLFSFSWLFGAVDINSASKEELTSVKGIGEKKAQAIIEYRESNCFDSIDELTSVKGFGEKTVENIADMIEAKPCKKEE